MCTLAGRTVSAGWSRWPQSSPFPSPPSSPSSSPTGRGRRRDSWLPSTGLLPLCYLPEKFPANFPNIALTTFPQGERAHCRVEAKCCQGEQVDCDRLDLSKWYMSMSWWLSAFNYKPNCICLLREEGVSSEFEYRQEGEKLVRYRWSKFSKRSTDIYLASEVDSIQATISKDKKMLLSGVVQRLRRPSTTDLTMRLWGEDNRLLLKKNIMHPHVITSWKNSNFWNHFPQVWTVGRPPEYKTDRAFRKRERQKKSCLEVICPNHQIFTLSTICIYSSSSFWFE